MSELTFPAEARWIGGEHPFDLQEVYVCFRRSLTLAAQPRRAELWLTADSRYKLWINGVFVARGPARCWPHAQSVDQLDVSAHVRQGRNILAVQVYQPGYSHFAYVHRAALGLLAALWVDGALALVTDSEWRGRRDPSFNSQVPRVSIYGSGVEVRDLRLASDWQTASEADSDWAASRVVAPVNGYPWVSLQPRALPLLVEHDLHPTLVETRRGRSAPDPDPHLALRAGWFQALPHNAPLPLASGESAYWLFDLGRGYACQGWADIDQATGHETLRLSYAEKFRDGQLVLSDPQTYCRVRLTDEFRLRAGAQRAESFALRGGRYVLFQLEGPSSAQLRFGVRVAEYPLEVTRPMALHDSQLAGIAAMCETTLRACLQDGFVDSVWRESSQWVGDALPQALIMSTLTDDVRPLRRVIEMAAQGAYPDGLLPSVVPGEVHAYAVADYGFSWIELLELHHTLTHAEAFLRAHWPTLVKLLGFFHATRQDEGLIVSPPGRRLFLDWAPVSRREPNAIYNLHYLLALRCTARLAQTLGEPTDWPERASALRLAVRARFWDGQVWWDDEARTTASQLAAALALLSGAVEPEEIGPILEAVVTRSLNDEGTTRPDTLILASPFRHHYIFEALRKYGRAEAVVEIIRRRWGRWVEARYPTTWENWEVDFPDGSQCHAFSAHPLYHLAQIYRPSAGE